MTPLRRSVTMPTKEKQFRMTTHDFGNGPVAAHQHGNGGGWVADTATVAATAYVGPDARVHGNAWVDGHAAVDGHAVVTGDALMWTARRWTVAMR